MQNFHVAVAHKDLTRIVDGEHEYFPIRGVGNDNKDGRT